MDRLEPYDKKADYSYCLGVFPALELMRAAPELALRLLIHPDGYASDGVSKLIEICREHGVCGEEAGKALRRESKKDNCYAAIAFTKREGTLDSARNHVALHNISDAGNFGTIVRTLVGLDILDIAVIGPCVDIFSPAAVRATMGACFHARIRGYDNYADYAEEFSGRSIYPFMLDGARELSAVAREASGPYTLIFGNEGAGLPAEFADYGQSVMIPQSNKIDSYNLASAVAMAAYAFNYGGNNNV